MKKKEDVLLKGILFYFMEKCHCCKVVWLSELIAGVGLSPQLFCRCKSTNIKKQNDFLSCKQIRDHKHGKNNACHAVCCHESKIYPTEVAWFYNRMLVDKHS